MTLKSRINQIFDDNTNYAHAQQVLNQANSLKSLSSDLYTDPIRFVYELIQNCDDSCQTNSILRIAIVEHRYLIVCHDGKPFDRDDISGLCDVGCSTKGRDEQKTGYKGLGFKSVFGQSDYVLIVSNGEFFRFDAKAEVFKTKWNLAWGTSRATWEEKNGKTFEYPWQICPIWTEKNEVPRSIREWLIGKVDAVGTIVHLRDPNEIVHALEEITKEPHVFMFLRNIRTIRFSFNSSKETTLSINQLRDGSTQIIYDGQAKSHWLLHRSNMSIPSDARIDPRLPDKLRVVSTIEVSLAVKIDKNDNIESLQGRYNPLFAYLPTKITTYDLPIVVNAQFSINASREHIHTDSPWNQFIFSRLPYETIHWISQLMKQEKWKEKAFDLLPKPILGQDALSKSYNDNYLKAESDMSFIPNDFKQLLKVREAIIDITGFSKPDCLGDKLIRDYIVNAFPPMPSMAEHPFVANNKRLRRYKITSFEWEHCLTMLKSMEFFISFTPEQDIQFISYLFMHQNLAHIQCRLRQLPFLMDHKGILRTMDQIYIPSHFISTDWSTANDTDPYVHENVMIWLKTQVPVLNWLKSLGVAEKTDEMYIRRKIIPNVRKYANRENTIGTVKKLLDNFQHGFLPNDVLFHLKKLKLLSMEDKLVSADELYFTDAYFPRLRLDNFHLDSSKFLSPVYLKEIPNANNTLKSLFLAIGVQEDIRWISFDEEQHNQLVAAYRFKQTENLYRYGLMQFHSRRTFPFLEITQYNYDFSVFFWQHIIQVVQSHEINEKETLVSPQQQTFKVDNLPTWFVRSQTCIPTTTRQLLKSMDVFSSDLRAIAGNFLPVFACKVVSPFPPAWQQFFQFKTQFSIYDHIHLLNSFYESSKQSSLNDENENCIQRLYSSLISCLQSENRNVLDQYRPSAPFYLLSTNSNEFLPNTSLVISSTKDLHLPNQIPQLKLSTGNARDTRLGHLLDFFNIRTIGIRDLTLPTTIPALPSLALRAKLRDVQASLLDLAQTQDITHHRIDYDLEVYEVDRLELFYNETIPVLQKDIHIVNNRVYITRPWASHKTLTKLSEVLCQEFQLPSNFGSQILQLLLREEQGAPSTMLPSFDSTLDLPAAQGTRQKLAISIERDNQQLFSQLKINDETTPAELLLRGLEAQNSSHSGFVYYYTHLENAVSILRNGLIECRSHLSPNDIQDETRSEVKDYVRFYFRPLTLAQYRDENLGRANLSQSNNNQSICPVPVIFRIELESILAIENIQWTIDPGNMFESQSDFENIFDTIGKFDFQGVYADLRTERGKYSSQQEFLIETQLDLNQLDTSDITLIFQDQNACDSLECMVTHDHRSVVDTSYYFNLNSRILIDYTDMDNEITISIVNLNKLVNSGQLILQLSGDDTNRTIQGNLNASFQRGTITTVYSPQQLSFIANLEHVQYAVYYKDKNHLWLIHTNTSAPCFIPPVQ
ncbi:unnamed protein product [Adineta ricciae]|uniref:DarT domain-containing protein n=1 Tax=Adineta ricciae TaxID=249248 RepID=A0A813ZLB5_ADIRI|nr:unnamed protein product [Adineta ricciae]